MGWGLEIDPDFSRSESVELLTLSPISSKASDASLCVLAAPPKSPALRKVDAHSQAA